MNKFIVLMGLIAIQIACASCGVSKYVESPCYVKKQNREKGVKYELILHSFIFLYSFFKLYS
jgi:hypothetical protein